MSKNQSSSRLKVMGGTGLPTLRSAHLPTPETPEEAERQEHEVKQAEHEDIMDAIRDADKLGDFMDHAPFVTDQSTTQIWGLKSAPEPVYNFSRWYWMVKQNAVVDLFKKQEDYDAADVEGRRALAHKYGTRYAALGPNHSRAPHSDPKLRKLYPSLVEQLAQEAK